MILGQTKMNSKVQGSLFGSRPSPGGQEVVPTKVDTFERSRQRDCSAIHTVGVYCKGIFGGGLIGGGCAIVAGHQIGSSFGHPVVGEAVGAVVGSAVGLVCGYMLAENSLRSSK
jgi:hypothetical protein